MHKSVTGVTAAGVTIAILVACGDEGGGSSGGGFFGTAGRAAAGAAGTFPASDAPTDTRGMSGTGGTSNVDADASIDGSSEASEPLDAAKEPDATEIREASNDAHDEPTTDGNAPEAAPR